MKSILCVDDAPIYLKIVESILQNEINDPADPEWSFRFEFINDPVKAIKFIEEMKEAKDDLAMIISDYNMPGMTGLEFLEKVKPLIPKTKMVLLTANKELDVAIKALNSNLLDRFISKEHIKQSEREEFVTCVRNQLSAYQMERVAENQRRQMEKMVESQQQQLIQADRMSTVGTMAAGVAHEINNPLNIATGDIHMVRRDMTDFAKVINAYSEIKLPPEESEKIEKVKKEIDLPYLLDHCDDKPSRCEGALKRIQEIVKNLRAFTHLETGEKAVVDINKNIEAALQFIPIKHKNGVEVQKEFSQLPSISCYGREINQVFINVLLNAFQFMKGKGVLKIKTELEGDKYVLIKISDTGTGIPEDNLKKIFEPFFTTKPIGEGTGLGLSTSYKAIEKHKGELSVINNTDKGATFTIKLPKPASGQN